MIMEEPSPRDKKVKPDLTGLMRLGKTKTKTDTKAVSSDFDMPCLCLCLSDGDNLGEGEGKGRGGRIQTTPDLVLFFCCVSVSCVASSCVS